MTLGYRIINFVLDATTGLLHGVLLQLILSFTLIFICGLYNDRWQPWHAEFEKFMLLHYFSIFAFMCVHLQPTKIMFVDIKYKNGKVNSELTDFASNNPIS